MGGMYKEAHQKIITFFKTQTNLAKELDISVMSVSKWKSKGIPANRCKEIEVLTKGAITRKQLRPDIFG
jgi:DNA-binding transcriptional regulator YdaS (Cro superfamily)